MKKIVCTNNPKQFMKNSIRKVLNLIQRQRG
ncbi:hypothetical protein CVS40_3248 [Lucilia cuprina]|nr:hypothetical protein CVS40_3248 [Lucilia cuprina]